jgi:hypothetical protein
MTTRERRERKAARLREWADKREAKSEAAYDKSRQIMDMIPFGQPILMGHHSQRRAERDQDRISRGMESAYEHGTKAREFKSRADNIEATLERSIYSDDPDAIEQLTKRVAELEAERDKVKADNAAFRKEHRAELKTMTAYQRDMAMPHRGYVTTNLTANIARNKKRLEELTRRLPVDNPITLSDNSSVTSESCDFHHV